MYSTKSILKTSHVFLPRPIGLSLIFLTDEAYFCLWNVLPSIMDFLGGLDGKASAYSAGELGSIPGSGRSLEKEMATHSSTLAWKIPWTEECGRLQSMGSQRVGHD